MTIKTIQEALRATVIEGKDRLHSEFVHVYASDLMSDVLAYGRPDSILLTGLARDQAIIAAHMAEFKAVVIVRGKKCNGLAQLAESHHLVLLSTPLDMYEACVRIESLRAGQLPAAMGAPARRVREETLLSHEMQIHGNDFTQAGMVSTEVKSMLKKIGFNPELVRRVAIATYEAEMNVVMHASHGKAVLRVTPRLIEVIVDDVGPGIPDVEAAMQEGWTTATEEMRKMGFGSGMGLPNIKRNSDDLNVTSIVGKGTKLQMQFFAEAR